MYFKVFGSCLRGVVYGHCFYYCLSKSAPLFPSFRFSPWSPRDPLILLLIQHRGEEPIRVRIHSVGHTARRAHREWQSFAPAGYICLSESGIRTMARIKGVYVWGMNVGISGMKSREKGGATLSQVCMLISTRDSTVSLFRARISIRGKEKK